MMNVSDKVVVKDKIKPWEYFLYTHWVKDERKQCEYADILPTSDLYPEAPTKEKTPSDEFKEK